MTAHFLKGQALKRPDPVGKAWPYKIKKNRFLFISITFVFLILSALAIFSSLYSTYISYADFIDLHPMKSLVIVDPSKIASVLSESYECGASKFCFVPSVALIILLLFIESYNGVLFWFFRKKIPMMLLFGCMIMLHSLLVFAPVGSIIIPSILINRIVTATDHDITQKLQTLRTSNQGILYDNGDILTALKNDTFAEIRIIEDDPLLALFLSLYAVDLKKIQGTFYQMVVLPSLATRHTDEAKKLGFALLLDTEKEYLYIFDTINQPDGLNSFKPLLNILSSKLVRGAYSEYIKKIKEPDMQVLDEYEYIAVQKQKTAEILKAYQAHIYTLEHDLAGIEQDLLRMIRFRDQLSSERKAYETSSNNWYRECVLQVSAENETCKNGKKTIDDSIRTIDTDRDTVEKNIITLTTAKSQFEREIAEERKIYADMVRDPITPEFQDGVYYSPSSIYIRDHGDDRQSSFAGYLSTSIHEYLHFVSDTGDPFPPFLEEGMTEYFNQKILSAVMLSVHPDIQKKKGDVYAEEVQVVRRLEEKMSPEELVSLYFSKNVLKFSELLGKKTYQTFISLGDRLYYQPLESITQKNNVYEQIQSLLDN